MTPIKNLVYIFIFIFVLMACETEQPIIQEKPANDTIINETKQDMTVPAPPKEPIQYSVSIAAIGDILAHSSIYQDAQTDANTYDFTNMFTQVKPYLERADITVANSESVIGGQNIGVSTYPRFNSPYELGDALKGAGIDVVNMANNHILDRGETAILNATNHWDQLGILYTGVSTSAEKATEIPTLTVNQITFSFLGYTYGTNGIPTPTGKEYLVHFINEEKMIEDIQRAKKISDVVVLNLHMGNEYERQFNEYQENIAQLAADQGVDIIFAHHPHVLQPIKWYEGENGHQTFVIHSLGNFLAAQEDIYCQIGAILELKVTKTIQFEENDKESVSITLSDPQLLPTYIQFTNWKKYEIIPMYRLTNDELWNAQEWYQDIQKHMSQYIPDLKFIEEEPGY